jgi:hypothetical protein
LSRYETNTVLLRIHFLTRETLTVVPRSSGWQGSWVVDVVMAVRPNQFAGVVVARGVAVWVVVLVAVWVGLASVLVAVAHKSDEWSSRENPFAVGGDVEMNNVLGAVCFSHCQATLHPIGATKNPRQKK